MRDIQLLKDKVATDNGVWVNMDDLVSVGIHVTGIGTATVKICVSNADTKPLNTVHEDQIGTDITADECVVIAGPFKWLKAYISAWTAGTINVKARGLQMIDVGRQVYDI